MKAIKIGLLMLMVMFVLPGTMYAQDVDPVEIVMARADAVNAGNVEAAAGFFAEDVVYDIADPQLEFFLTLSGIEEVRERMAEIVAANANFVEVEIRQVQGDTVIALTKYVDDGLRSEGVAYIEGLEEYTVQDGKIVSFKWTTQGVVEESAPQALPVSGGRTFPIYVLVILLGGLVLATGLGLALRYHLSTQ